MLMLINSHSKYTQITLILELVYVNLQSLWTFWKLQDNFASLFLISVYFMGAYEVSNYRCTDDNFHETTIFRLRDMPEIPTTEQNLIKLPNHRPNYCQIPNTVISYAFPPPIRVVLDIYYSHGRTRCVGLQLGLGQRTSCSRACAKLHFLFTFNHKFHPSLKSSTVPVLDVTCLICILL